MKRLGRHDGVATRLAAVLMGASLAALACGSSSRTPEVSPAASVHPAPRPAPVVSAVRDAGPAPVPLPRTVSLDAFGEGERIADLTGLAVGERMLLAWVTYFDDGAAALRRKGSRPSSKAASPGAEPSKQGASVLVRPLDKDGEALGPAKVVSVKAVSSGGVALARASGSGSEVGLAWVGIDGGVGQVFVTRLSDTGDKQAQRMVSHSKTGCSDVGIAAVADGFVVAWVESKEPKTEVFVAKVGKDLARVGAERRVAEAKGEASDVRVVRRGDDVLVVWNDARKDGDGGVAAARLLTADLTVRGDPAVVVSATHHPRGLELSPFGDGVEVAWVEDGPSSGNAPTRSLFRARLDASTRSSAGKVAVPAIVDPTSVALDCDRVCRVVAPVDEHGELALYAFSFDGSQQEVAPKRLFSIAGASTEDTSPILVNDWLFFAEDNMRGGGRIRKAKLAW